VDRLSFTENVSNLLTDSNPPPVWRPVTENVDRFCFESTSLPIRDADLRLRQSNNCNFYWSNPEIFITAALISFQCSQRFEPSGPCTKPLFGHFVVF